MWLKLTQTMICQVQFQNSGTSLKTLSQTHQAPPCLSISSLLISPSLRPSSPLINLSLPLSSSLLINHKPNSNNTSSKTTNLKINRTSSNSNNPKATSSPSYSKLAPNLFSRISSLKEEIPTSTKLSKHLKGTLPSHRRRSSAYTSTMLSSN